mgnify:CR=1 FL=1
MTGSRVLCGVALGAMMCSMVGGCQGPGGDSARPVAGVEGPLQIDIQLDESLRDPVTRGWPALVASVRGVAEVGSVGAESAREADEHFASSEAERAGLGWVSLPLGPTGMATLSRGDRAWGLWSRGGRVSAVVMYVSLPSGPEVESRRIVVPVEPGRFRDAVGTVRVNVSRRGVTFLSRAEGG